ncbi:hypothetical protein BJX99DRAFT_101606 [Aspergillus californicus]
MERITRLSTTLARLPSPVLVSTRSIFSTSQLRSDSSTDKAAAKPSEGSENPEKPSTPERKKTKSMAQSDEDIRRRLEEMSGEGGAAGLEYEDGKPQTMKRSVRNNMFRYI